MGTAQVFYNNGAILKINNGAQLTINGSFFNAIGSSTDNLGNIIISENYSNLSNIGGSGRLTFRGASGKVFSSTLQAQLGKIYLDTLSGEVTLQQQMQLNDTVFIAGGSVLNNASFDLNISGFLSGNGCIKTNGNANLSINTPGNAGTLFLDQSFDGVSNKLRNITLNNNTTLKSGNTIHVSNVVNVISGTLNASGNLVLNSDSVLTARVAELNPGADITGNVVVQRYIPPITRRSRILSSPVQSFSFNQLIDDIFITGTGGSTNGFDQSTVNNATIYTYQEDTSGGGRGWKAISHINNTLATAKGSLVFIRGDRSLTGWNTAPFPLQNKVVIDYANSPINKGTISPSVTYTNTGSAANDGWNMLGNPYPSPISWSCLSKTNISAFYYTLNPLTGSYEANNGTDAIASGQGFFVQAVAANPSITFTENCKVGSTPVNYFKTGNAIITARLIRDSLNADMLKVIFASGSAKHYHPAEDAIKLTNSLLNIATLVNHDSIRLQYHTTPLLTQLTDTVHLFASAQVGNYTFDFSGIGSVDHTYDVFLADSYNNNLLNLRSQPVYTFSITNNPLTANNKRFKLIFNKVNPLPIALLAFNATKSGNDNKLVWVTSAENNIVSFGVQKSVDGINWSDIGLVKAKGNSNTKVNYTFTDVNAFKPHLNRVFYRLQIREYNGTNSFTNMVVIDNDILMSNPEIQVYPNPVTEAVNINSNCDIRRINLFNIHGIEIMELQPGNVSYDLSQLPIGIYMLHVNTNCGKTITKLLKE